MKYLMILFLVNSAFASNYKVELPDYHFILEDGSKEIKFEDRKLKLNIKKESCSKDLEASIPAKLESIYKNKIVYPKNPTGLIKIAKDDQLFYVPKSQAEKELKLFGDFVAKIYAMKKEACSRHK